MKKQAFIRLPQSQNNPKPCFVKSLYVDLAQT
jgi:hypothetical protein